MSKWRTIRSRQNDNYKRWCRWADHSEDPDCPWLLVEGPAQVRDTAALRRPVLLVTAEGHQDAIDPDRASEGGVVLSEKLFARLSQARSGQGIAAFFEKPHWSWQDATRHILYLDGVQDPGNLGTLIRTAAATGLFSIVTSPGSVSSFNSKVVRSTAATLFQVPLIASQSLQELTARDYSCWVAEARRGVSLFDVKFEAPLALIIGAESAGPSQTAPHARRVQIPMADPTESLNLAVAGSLLLYEVLRGTDDEIIV